MQVKAQKKVATKKSAHKKVVAKTQKTKKTNALSTQKRSHHCVTAVNAEKAPAAVGPYVHATKANGMVFVSGQLPLDPATMKFNSDSDVALQAQQCLVNMKNILEAAGSDMNHVMKTTILLKNMGDFQKVNKVYAEHFTTNLPARVCYAVQDLPLGALVEIDAVAVEAKHTDKCDV